MKTGADANTLYTNTNIDTDTITIIIIIHSTHYLFSDWPKAYSEFSKSAPRTSSGCRLYNNHVKDTQGHG